MPTSTGYVITVRLVETPEPVYREFTVPKRYTFHQLHKVIQLAMGWQGTHLYEFQIGPLQIGIPTEDFEEINPDVDATRVHLSWADWDVGSTFQYVYDLGDYWQHEGVITEISEDPEIRARVLAGSGACPPEDVGGAEGYADFLKIIADPSHEQYQETRRWAWQRYEFTGFSLQAANQRLTRTFPGKRSAAKKTKKKVKNRKGWYFQTDR